tara:strand:+ start:2206 stop:5244 length:3039 start_codon:yes stop_codon:yes gene_type:complete
MFHLVGQSSSQIKQAKNMMKKTGMSLNEAKKIAKSQGYSDKQINNVLKKELGGKIESSDSKIEASENNDEINADKSIILNQFNPLVDDNISGMTNDKTEENVTVYQDGLLDVVDEKDIKINSDEEIANNTSVKYFGYEIFERDPAIFQASSVGAVNPDYLIGPSDEIIVMLWGETQFRQVLKVNREGFIFIPEVGQVFVNGLNLNLLESKLFRVLSQSYASLNPQGSKATTFLDISLGNLRSLRIQVLGEVAQPGAYTVSPSATLFSGLYYFNGPTVLGSLRDIRLIRGDKKITSIDFYDYLLTGKKPFDQKLQRDDIIFIPKRMKTVTIKGEISRPGIYELKPSETLKDLIEMARDLKITAYLDRVQIDRIIPFEDRNNLGMDRTYIDINLNTVLSSNQKFHLEDGDEIQIFSVQDLRQNVVEINGAVTRPGFYDIGDSLRLKEVILKADSLLGDAYLPRVDVVRTNSDFSKSLIKLNLKKVLDKNNDHNILLKNYDKINIYSTSEMKGISYISISGHVKNPGRYQLLENMNLYDLIFKAGGFFDITFRDLTYLNRAEIIRYQQNFNDKKIIPFDLSLVLDKKGLSQELLKENDIIRIYSKEEIEGLNNFVSITGHVKRPGKYELYQENMRLYDLLFRAGGFEDPNFKDLTFLDRADIVRFDENRINQKIIPFNIGAVLEDQNHLQNLKLFSGDIVRVYSREVFNSVRSVSISGEVKNPGSYSWKTNMTIKDLILESGGVSKDIFRYKIEISRIDPEVLNENIFSESINLEMDNDYKTRIMSYETDENEESFNFDREEFLLKPYDFVFVRQDPHFRMQRQIEINGSVYYPGSYVLINPNEYLSDIVKRSGGLRPNAYPEASLLTRGGKNLRISIKKLIKKPKSKDDIILQEGDKIFIASKPNIVDLVGQVAVPGTYKFVKGRRVSDYLDIAGGLTLDAEKEDIWVTGPDGRSKKWKRWLSNPKVEDGSQITIGRAKEAEPFDETEFAKEIASILADFAQVVSILIIAISSN